MATIRDVAKMSGVSTATVSHVLNGRTDRVSADTRDRVLAAVRALKYRPTPLERNQKAILTRNLAVVAQDLTESPLERHAYFRRTLDGILEVAGFRGWSVTLFVQRMWGEMDQVVRRSYDGRCDGVIVVAPEMDNEVVRTLHERGTPLCLIGTTPWLPDASCVDLDNVATGDLVARHFLSLGHRRLAYLAHDLRIVSSRERHEGFSRTARQAGADVETIIFPPYASIDHIAGMLARRGEERPTGILCWHDALARTLADALVRHGVQVPADMSVAGIDDDPETSRIPPGLTTVPNPVRAIGKRAATMLIDRFESDQEPEGPEIVRFAPDLIVRGTTGPAPNLGSTAQSFLSNAIGTNGGATPS